LTRTNPSLVTGAAGGIGRATALAFAREGAGVVLADVDEKANAESAHLIGEAGGHVATVAVTSPAPKTSKPRWKWRS